MKHNIIKAVVNDSADYEFITDQGIHNTLQNIWQWSDKNDIEISFTKDYTDNFVHGLELIVEAEFKHPEDLALYKISFGFEPFNKLDMANGEPEFIHG